jgi:hypothetical protein
MREGVRKRDRGSKKETQRKRERDTHRERTKLGMGQHI